PEVRRSPSSPPEPPYDVTAWSLGMLLGVNHVMVHKPLADGVQLRKLDAGPQLEGTVTGTGPSFVFDYRGPDAARAINRLLKAGAHVTLETKPGADGRSSRVWVTNAPRKA